MRKLLLLALAAVAFAAPARASFGPSAVLYHLNVSRITAPLSTISDINVIADLDSTLSSSYGGSGQTWSNIISSPVDGSTTAANALYLGQTSAVNTDDPTFTGTAGQTAAYFAFNGGNDMGLAGSNTTFLSGLQNDTQSFWFTICFNLGGSGTSTLFSTVSSSSTAGITAVANPSGSPKITFSQFTTSSKQIVGINPTALVSGSDMILIISHQAGGNTRAWLNSTTDALSTTTFQSGSVSASHALVLGARNTTNPIVSGSKVRAFSYGTDYLTDAQAGEIIHRLESRHQIDYDGNGTIGN